MNRKSLHIPYLIFISAWLVIFIFCSILSGVASSAGNTDKEENPKKPEQTAVTTTAASTDSKPPVSAAPDTPDEPDPPSYSVDIPLPSDPNNANYLIYLDAGHGWYDNGCSILDRTDIYEKDVNLAITLRIRDALETMGYTVGMIRENDEDSPEPLEKGVYDSVRRISYANRQGADYYVSIHIDHFDNPDTKGTRIYYIDRFPECAPLSEHIADSIAENLHIDKPLIKNDIRYNVLVLNAMPAVLIEAGFATNAEDVANMLDPNWQEAFARSVALGIDAQVKSEAVG